MIVFCIKNFVFKKSGSTLGTSLLKNVSTIFVNPSKYIFLETNGNIKYHLRAISHVSLQKELHDNSANTNISKNNILNVQLKKRPLKKKKLAIGNEQMSSPDSTNVKALATAEEYNLEDLLKGLTDQNLYVPKTINTSGKPVPDVIHAVPKYDVGHGVREIFFFREGTVVMWNTPELESGNILQFLKTYEENSFASSIVQSEMETMSYTYAEPGRQSYLKDGDICLATNATSLDKYTFSNALSQSVKLGIWEASLDHYIDSMEFVTDDLKSGKKIKMSREEVLKKQGQLLALRHVVNLSSDFLDTPDFYWENDELENLYQKTCSNFAIPKRTRVINEKINHCVELVELLSSHLSDRHHIRLEWMIIILIVVEVVFEMIHFVDRYIDKSLENKSSI